MPQFIGRDMPADLLQYRLLRRFPHRAVVGAGADLDDTARDHLAGAGAPPRAVAVEIDLEPVLKAREGGGEIEAGIGHGPPAGQGPPMLNLFLAPAPRGCLEFGVVGEDSAEVMRVSGAVVLDQACRLDDPHEFRIDPAWIEPVPPNVVERPPAHAAPLCQLALGDYTRQRDNLAAAPHNCDSGRGFGPQFATPVGSFRHGFG